MPSVIQADNVSKIFRDFWWRPKVRAVTDLSFEVEKGRVFGLLGPNGSGKSTTIKMILGLLHPSGGELNVLDRKPTDVAAKARIGYLPEESYLYSYLTSEETLRFYGRLFNLPTRILDRRIEELLEMIGLTHAARRTVGEFSKGMARRIGLAQALINDPDLVILDEPTSGLDPIGCRQVKDIIKALSERGKTVLLSSHLLADVEDVCDRIVILYNGKVQARGTMRSLLEEKTQHRIDLPELEPDTLKRVLELLRREIGQDLNVTHPRRNLEQFFLDVVNRARHETEEASGAQPFGRLAPYLEGTSKTEATGV